MEQKVKQYIIENYGEIIEHKKIYYAYENLVNDAIKIFNKQTQVFYTNGVEIIYVKKTNNEPCTYVESTFSKPILLIDEDSIKKLCNESGIKLKCAIYVSVFHELTRAILDLDTKKHYFYFADNFENLDTEEGIEEFLEINTISFWEKGKPTKNFLDSCQKIFYEEFLNEGYDY